MSQQAEVFKPNGRRPICVQALGCILVQPPTSCLSDAARCKKRIPTGTHLFLKLQVSGSVAKTGMFFGAFLLNPDLHVIAERSSGTLDLFSLTKWLESLLRAGLLTGDYLTTCNQRAASRKLSKSSVHQLCGTSMTQRRRAQEHPCKKGH